MCICVDIACYHDSTNRTSGPGQVSTCSILVTRRKVPCFLGEETLYRRQFIAASLSAAAVAVARTGNAQTAADHSPEFYSIRRYELRAGPQMKLTESYFGDALIPALSRMGMGPIGAFGLNFGPIAPTFYLLIPSSSLEALAMLEPRLAQDSTFLAAAEPFWNAPATSPAFLRVEGSLLKAFDGWPRVTLPATSVAKGKRIFQLRTYESPSNGDHVRKVQMFHDGEFQIFRNAGFHPVFYGDTLIGPRMPNMTYLLSFANMEEMNAKWDAFNSDPAWKKLSTLPEYGFEQIVSNVSNLILNPLSVSQI